MSKFLNKFIILNEVFDLKGTLDVPLLYNFQTKESFDLSADQWAFLANCTGRHTIGSIFKIWSPSSLRNLKIFIANLSNIGAVAFSDKPFQKIRIFNPLVEKPPLKAIHFELTNKCNLKCSHCYQDKYFLQKELSTDMIFKLIEDLKRLNVLKIGISGGEPFLRKDLFRILQHIEINKITISSILTNGTLINKEILGNLSQLKSPVILFISLDGITSEGMRLRGGNKKFQKNLISKIIQGVKLCQQADIPVWINTCVHKYNIGELLKIYKLLKELKVQGWRLALPKRIGAFARNYPSFTIPYKKVFDTYRKLIKLYLKEIRDKKNLFTLQIEYFFREDVLKDLNFYSPNSFVCDYDNKHYSCCIKPNGDVTPCALLVDEIIGNITKKTIKEIWYSAKMKKIKFLQVKDIKCPDKCRYKLFCGCGCRAVALSYGNGIKGKDNDACAAMSYFKKKVAPLLSQFLSLKSKF